MQEVSAVRKWQRKRRLINILPETRERVGRLGCKGDTYDDIIQKMLDFIGDNKDEWWKKTGRWRI